MRPDVRQSPTEQQSGRIIYLGDVRRRRSPGRRAPDRHYLAVLGVIAGAAWIAWAIVLFNLEPAKLLTYLAFFAPLGMALAATATIGAYGIEWLRGYIPSLTTCGRRGALASGAVVLNLVVLATRQWTPAVILIAAFAIAVAELVAWRKESWWLNR